MMVLISIILGFFAIVLIFACCWHISITLENFDGIE